MKYSSDLLPNNLLVWAGVAIFLSPLVVIYAMKKE
jgi:hypothetical protein